MKNIDLTTIQDKNLIIDISKLLSDEVIYINATKLSLQFNKDRRRLNDFLNSKQFLEYKNAVSNVRKNRTLELIKIVKGKYGGTYLHSDLVVIFLRWLDIEFAIKCDMYIKKAIQEVHNDKIITTATIQANKSNLEWLKAREVATSTRNNLTDTIKKFCEYAQNERGKPYKGNKCPYYIKLTNLVYQVLDIKKPKGTQSNRDVFNGVIVEKIEYLENMLINLLLDHISQETEYHEAFKNVKQVITSEFLCIKKVVDYE